MFKFELGQSIFFMRDNEIETSKVISRKYVDCWTQAEEEWCKFGKDSISYVTKKGEIPEELAYSTEKALTAGLVKARKTRKAEKQKRKDEDHERRYGLTNRKDYLAD